MVAYIYIHMFVRVCRHMRAVGRRGTIVRIIYVDIFSVLYYLRHGNKYFFFFFFCVFRDSVGNSFAGVNWQVAKRTKVLSASM